MIADDDDRLVGVFSDRDALVRVAERYDEVKDLPVSQVMTANPVFIRNTDSAAAALCVMAVSGYRHVPVVDIDGQIVGIVSPQRVTAFLLAKCSTSE
jgi:CBS domain-containing protein